MLGEGSVARDQFETVFAKLTEGGSPVVAVTLRTQGRAVKIPKASLGRRVARFTFHEICGKPVRRDSLV